MSILCIGQAAYDITLPVQGEIIENQKYRVFNKFECLGGPATNASYLCASWGAPTTLLCRLGNDVYGKSIIDGLKEIGMNVDHIQVLSSFQTPLSIILNHQNSGARTIFNCPGTLESVPYTFPKECDVLLFDGHELEASLEALQRYPNAISILDAGTLRENTQRLASEVDYLICSESFAKAYVDMEWDIYNHTQNKKAFAKLKQLNNRHVVVTFGEHGLLYEEDGQIKHMKAYSVKALDTTGAGDIFHGAFAYAMHENMKLKDALKLSSMTSAISVTRMGGQPSIPTIEEVKQALFYSKKR